MEKWQDGNIRKMGWSLRPSQQVMPISAVPVEGELAAWGQDRLWSIYLAKQYGSESVQHSVSIFGHV
jgi:hypothetical protein